MNCILTVKSIVVIVMERTHRNQTNLQFILLVYYYLIHLPLSCLLCDIELCITAKRCTHAKEINETYAHTDMHGIFMHGGGCLRMMHYI